MAKIVRLPAFYCGLGLAFLLSAFFWPSTRIVSRAKPQIIYKTKWRIERVNHYHVVLTIPSGATLATAVALMAKYGIYTHQKKLQQALIQAGQPVKAGTYVFVYTRPLTLQEVLKILAHG